ncbi:hypothetical protein T484DRAFT_3001072 [Baffinella frigidus]|nr:hypothetical protein T484DRAFT_3001072 [Cryptophyta sp. CCMP2293]
MARRASGPLLAPLLLAAVVSASAAASFIRSLHPFPFALTAAVLRGNDGAATSAFASSAAQWGAASDCGQAAPRRILCGGPTFRRTLSLRGGEMGGLQAKQWGAWVLEAERALQALESVCQGAGAGADKDDEVEQAAQMLLQPLREVLAVPTEESPETVDMDPHEWGFASCPCAVSVRGADTERRDGVHSLLTTLVASLLSRAPTSDAERGHQRPPSEASRGHEECLRPGGHVTARERGERQEAGEARGRGAGGGVLAAVVEHVGVEVFCLLVPLQGCEDARANIDLLTEALLFDKEDAVTSTLTVLASLEERRRHKGIHDARPQLANLARLLHSASPKVRETVLPDVLSMVGDSFITEWAKEQEDLKALQFVDVTAFAVDVTQSAVGEGCSEQTRRACSEQTRDLLKSFLSRLLDQGVLTLPMGPGEEATEEHPTFTSSSPIEMGGLDQEEALMRKAYNISEVSRAAVRLHHAFLQVSDTHDDGQQVSDTLAGGQQEIDAPDCVAWRVQAALEYLALCVDPDVERTGGVKGPDVERKRGLKSADVERRGGQRSPQALLRMAAGLLRSERAVVAIKGLELLKAVLTSHAATVLPLPSFGEDAPSARHASSETPPETASEGHAPRQLEEDATTSRGSLWSSGMEGGPALDLDRPASERSGGDAVATSCQVADETSGRDACGDGDVTSGRDGGDGDVEECLMGVLEGLALCVTQCRSMRHQRLFRDTLQQTLAAFPAAHTPDNSDRLMPQANAREARFGAGMARLRAMKRLKACYPPPGQEISRISVGLDIVLGMVFYAVKDDIVSARQNAYSARERARSRTERGAQGGGAGGGRASQEEGDDPRRRASLEEGGGHPHGEGAGEHSQEGGGRAGGAGVGGQSQEDEEEGEGYGFDNCFERAVLDALPDLLGGGEKRGAVDELLILGASDSLMGALNLLRLLLNLKEPPALAPSDAERVRERVLAPLELRLRLRMDEAHSQSQALREEGVDECKLREEGSGDPKVLLKMQELQEAQTIFRSCAIALSVVTGLIRPLVRPGGHHGSSLVRPGEGAGLGTGVPPVVLGGGGTGHKDKELRPPLGRP